MAQKTNVEPDVATYLYNSMLYKFVITNYAWHNDLPTGRIQPVEFDWPQKQL